MEAMQRNIDQLQNWAGRYEQQLAVSTDNELFHQQHHDLREECEKLRQHNQQLQEQNAEYVDLLTTSSGDHVMDQDVICKFQDLRSVVHEAVVEIWMPKFESLHPPTSDEHSKILQELMGDEGPYNLARFQNKICGIITQVLKEFIFDRPLFGWHDTTDEVASYMGKLEDYFGDIVPKVHCKDVAQWRKATMKCSSYFDDAQSTPAQEAMNQLSSRIGPITQHDSIARSKASEKILKLCNDAYELQLLMRKAEDTFVVQDFSGKLVAGVADFVTKFGDEPRNTGDTSDTTDTVAFSRFGALVKYPIGESDKDPIVLEKAHAVFYAETP
ncbi:hypothetical protein PG989_015832 [Apiospora arundinis]